MQQTNSIRTISHGPHDDQPIVMQGASLDEATGALILLHGRGASAQSILGLADVLARDDTACLAPQAAGATWYPHRFIAPIEQNEPFLSSALEVVGNLVRQVSEAGIARHRIVLAGFSQGACLACEFAARHPARFGAILVFSGGLIGPMGELRDYKGSFEGTPVFLGCSDIDAHIPVERVHESEAILADMDARVTKSIYPGMGHTISAEEIKEARTIIFEALA